MNNSHYYGWKKKKLPVRLIFSAVVTAVSCLLAYLVMVPLSESFLAKLFSTPETSDFILSDLFIQFADARPVRHLDNRIIVVDVGYAGRQEIAEALEIIAVAEPKVVGLDINFPNHEGGGADKFLEQSILLQKNILLPLGLTQDVNGFYIEEKPYFYDTLISPSIHYAASNFPTKSGKASIREFEVEFRINSDSVLPSYVVGMARVDCEENYRILKERGNNQEAIDYASREFTVIPIHEILDRVDELTDKYVLMGSMGDAYDMHATPLNSTISGLMVHANALSTLLDKAWYTFIPDIVDYITGFILCFFLVFISESLPGRGKGMALGALQLFFLILVVWFGYTLFLDKHIIINLSFTFFVVGLGIMVLDMGNLFWNIGVWIAVKNKNKRIKNMELL